MGLDLRSELRRRRRPEERSEDKSNGKKNGATRALRNVSLLRTERFRKVILLEKLQVQRSHGISGNVFREKIGTLCTAALKRNDNRNLLS